MTNFEKIKKMSIDELAKELTIYDDDNGCYRCPDNSWFDDDEIALSHTTEWLKQECDN